MTRIVVPLDESELAEEALPWAAYLARVFRYAVHLVAVWTPEDEIYLRADTGPGPSTEHIGAVLERYLGEVRRREVFEGITVTAEVRIGKVAEHICEVSLEHDTRLAVLTSHGRGGVRRFIQGSVADTLVRTLSIPVFVVRPGEGKPPIERIVLTLDGSETSEVGLPPARGLAAATGAQLHLLRVSNPLAELPYAGMGPAPDLGDLARQLLEVAQAYLQETARENEICEVRSGRPLDVITEYAREAKCDVIVMGTHGRGGVVRLALGSTADAVMRAADRPVLLIPERASESDAG